MKKIAFEDLTPVPVTINGVIHTLSPAEYARICLCAVKGTPSEVKYKIMTSQLPPAGLQALQVIGQMQEAYAGNKFEFTPFEKRKPKPTPRDFQEPPTSVSVKEKIDYQIKKAKPTITTDKGKVQLPADEYHRICPCGTRKVFSELIKLTKELKA